MSLGVTGGNMQPQGQVQLLLRMIQNEPKTVRNEPTLELND
jgi:gamma-glutamyltranspeptidase